MDCQISIEPLLVGAGDAARILGMSRSYFCSLNQAGFIGPMPIRFGKKTLWGTDQLRQWVDAGCPQREVWVKRAKSLTGTG